MAILLGHRKLVVLALLRNRGQVKQTELAKACALIERGLFSAVSDLEDIGFVYRIQQPRPSKGVETFYEISELGKDCIDDISSQDKQYSNI